MNRLATYFLLLVIFFMFPPSFAVEPDESGIGGTGISNPTLGDEIFNRPEVPEFVDTPEAPELSIPELNDGRETGPDTAIDDIETPVDASD